MEGRYLGLTISDNMSWKSHVAAVNWEESKTHGFRSRNLSSCPPSLITRISTTLVRLTFE
ncbi:hypothetical protein DPMN_145391 [Dreissena polymorpha]|uniref:Uncharacterized protein n=1 Tax=Dreissena polymorpha TaxID=45954 RepID=A0A9D4IYR8_DREPO|nr:hypothetical protein DPMN_145391 [Dreissena polymorpha]